MVDPISDAERAAFTRRLQAVFVLLVAGSAALTAVRSGAGTAVALGSAVAGVVVALALLLLLGRWFRFDGQN